MLELNALEHDVVIMNFRVPDDFTWVYPVSYTCGEITSSPGAFSRGQDGLLLYIISGHGEIRMEGETFAYLPRQVVTAADASRLELYPAIETQYLCLLMRNTGDLLNKLTVSQPGDAGVNAVIGSEINHVVGADSEIGLKLVRFYNDALNGMPQDIFTASAQVYALIMELRGSLWKGRKFYSSPVQDAIAIISEEYPYLTGIDELAERLEISKCHLVRIFSAEVGKGPGQYLQEVRLEHAKLLLSSSDYDLSLISGMTGYSCSNYFCKAFREKFGLSPGRYRKLQKPRPSDLESFPKLREMEDIFSL